MAKIALSILWGGALCGLGYFLLMSLVLAASRREEDAGGVVVIAAVVFLALLLVTLAVADVFNVIDVFRRRPK